MTLWSEAIKGLGREVRKVAAKEAERMAGRTAARSERIPQRLIQSELESIGPRGSSARQRYIDLIKSETQPAGVSLKVTPETPSGGAQYELQYPRYDDLGNPTMPTTIPRVIAEDYTRMMDYSQKVRDRQIEKRMEAIAISKTGVAGKPSITYGTPEWNNAWKQIRKGPETPVRQAIRRGMVVRGIGAGAVGGAGAIAAGGWDEDKRGPAPRLDRPWKNSY